MKKFTTDAAGQLTQVVEDPSGLQWATNYSYDVLGHLTGVSMPRTTGTQTRAFNYQNVGGVQALLQSERNSENGTTSYTYLAGRLATKTDAKGQVFAYSYDTLGRLSTVKRYGSWSD